MTYRLQNIAPEFLKDTGLMQKYINVQNWQQQENLNYKKTKWQMKVEM
jgi:hypothetical protein